MPKKEPERITIQATKTQANFLHFCEDVGFAEVKITIMHGDPVILREGIKQRRFDLTNDASNTTV